MTGIEDAQNTFTEIADAIRSKTGKIETMLITQMAEEIESISVTTVSVLTVSVSPATCSVTVSGGGLETAVTKTAQSGTVSFDLPPGYDYSVSASYDAYLTQTKTVHVDMPTASATFTLSAKPRVTVNQSGGTGTITVTGGTYTTSGNVYTLDSVDTNYVFACSQISLHVKPENQTVNLPAGGTTTITFTHVAYPTVTVSQTGATSAVTCSPTAQAQSDYTYTLIPNTSYTFSVAQVEGYFKPADQTVNYSAGTTNTISFQHLAKPVLTVTVNGTGSGGLTVSATNGTDTQTGTTNSSGVATIVLNGTGTYTVSVTNPPSGASATTATVTVSAGDAASCTLTLSYGFGFTIVAIAEGTSDPYARCSYPASVTINSKTYTNSIPSTGFTEARGTSLNGWAVADNACSKLIEGIRPVALNGSTWVTTGYSLTNSGAWDLSYDWFTEFPFRWMAWYKTGSTVYIIFSDKNENPDSTIFQDYAFLNNSNVRKSNMHIGCFDGTVSSGILYSKPSSGHPQVDTSITNFINYAKAKGTDFDIITFYQVMYITGLFITLYKTTDCQGYSNSSYGLGKGYVGGSSVQSLFGLSFDNNYGMYGDRSGTTSRVSFFWIHDIWGNIYDFVGGAKTNSSNVLLTQTGKVSSVTESDFNVNTGVSSSAGGYVTAIAGGQKTGPFPTASSSGSDTTYYSDYAYVYASYFPSWGGYYNFAGSAGLFYWTFSYSATGTNSRIGSRLSFKGGRT